MLQGCLNEYIQEIGDLDGHKTMQADRSVHMQRVEEELSQREIYILELKD